MASTVRHELLLLPAFDSLGGNAPASARLFGVALSFTIQLLVSQQVKGRVQATQWRCVVHGEATPRPGLGRGVEKVGLIA